jgi:uncharacterized protein YcfJ
MSVSAGSPKTDRTIPRATDFCETRDCNNQPRRYLCAWALLSEAGEEVVNKSLAVGLVIGAIAASTVGAVAGYRMLGSSSGAEVVSAKALTKTIKTPRQECHDEQVTHTKPIKDQDRLVGTGIGAVVGGLLGSRVGGGNTRIVTGLAGAAAGGYAGNKIQQKVQQGNTYTTTEQRCITAYDTHEEPAGYEVVYMLDGKRHHVHMDHDPGQKIPVRDGQIVIDAPKHGGSEP